MKQLRDFGNTLSKWKEALESEVLDADDLVLKGEAIEGLGNTLSKWKEALESEVLDADDLVLKGEAIERLWEYTQ